MYTIYQVPAIVKPCASKGGVTKWQSESGGSYLVLCQSAHKSIVSATL